ncbi:Disease resistance protein [Melia azedarach]|uniref:Disease resistance protein n=1 Tax=Melia azedarach TaxID=155640 RepID=A0ACC1Y0S7_MELAZ|nr:Disease resistance protein [Melia azedarach]
MAETIVIDVVKCVGRYLAPSVELRIGYLDEYQSNFKKLQAEVEKLKRKRTEIQQKISAKKNEEEIEENVQKWLKRADEIEQNAQELQKRARKKVIPSDSAAEKTRGHEEKAAGNIREEEQTAPKKRWFKWFSPGLKTRYQLGKEAVMQREAVVEHLNAGEFGQISHPNVLMDPRLCIKDFETFESRASTLTEVISSLSDPDATWLGFMEWPNSDIMKIQKEIGEKLGRSLSQEESESTRAGRLHQQLMNEKSILIILTNIWNHLHLQAIGIPHRDDHKGCKLLLSASDVNVLSSMDSKKNFVVHHLHPDEALRFFQKMVGEHSLDSKFKPVATELVKKCAGLPIAIVAVARALRNKHKDYVWKDFLLRVQMSKDFQGIYASIESSYKYLESDQQKTLLLIQYANLTSTDELLIYGMSLGLFDYIKEMEGRCARVQTLFQELKDSCLLLDGNTTHDDFFMLDIVRDTVKSIACRDLHAFTKEGDARLEWPDKLKAYPSIVLKDVKSGELPSVLNCPQLKLLSISATDPGLFSESSSLKIDNDFFKMMTGLKVLVLANMDLSSLPTSISLLSNLQALGLYNCKLDDMATLGKLQKLEIFSLRNSKIERWSAELCHLIRLKFLDLRSTNVPVISPNCISSLPTLEELRTDKFTWKRGREMPVWKRICLELTCFRNTNQRRCSLLEKCPFMTAS